MDEKAEHIYQDSTLPCILVVDDEQHICELVTEMLEGEGYNIISSTDTHEALKMIEDNSINAVLTDLVMDDVNGVDILRKAKEHHPDAVLILMTGQPTLENVITVLREGAYDYLIKPFTLDTLRMTFQRGLSKQRLQRENVQLKELINIYKIGEDVGSGIELNEILKVIVESTIKEFDCDGGAVLLKSEHGDLLEVKAQRGVPEGFFKKEYLKIDMEHLSAPLINNYSEDNKLVDSYNTEGVRSHLCHPLMIHGKCGGQIHLIRTKNQKPFIRNNLVALSLIASKSATAIENATLLKNLENTYLATLSALANAIETRDEYTRGHTERVFQAAEAIAIELGWEEERLKSLRMGGLLHDIGKIGVPDAILNKPGPLTSEEFEIMKSHPILGAKIVEGIPFLKPAMPYILYHHERFDGTGYPHGLAGEDIPIEGRILAVVDTIDAITSDRPYRKGMGIDKAIDELNIHSGTQFDPEIVKVALKVLPKIFKDELKKKSAPEPQPTS
ncbi:MAG: response regulator [candidate division Zixibacteria bacterium]|nr:response regulator [candidate division Zixibacteria bacterium]